jgi:hypothetical protein
VENVLKTATVETLTAEVRVLMVGSRQVTMSVYEQLDYVEPLLIEPFGRVRPKKNLAYAEIHVVGRDSDGNLVRSYVPSEPMKLSDDGYLSTWGATAKYRLWNSGGDAERESLAATAAAWSSLPLIVLAGLR